MDRHNLVRGLFLALIVAVVAAGLFSPLADWFSITNLKQSRLWLTELVDARPYLWAAAFFSLCVVATALCFPAAPVLGISGGALFGFWPGLIIVIIASSIGSTIAFFDSRYLLRDWVKQKLGRRMRAIDKGMEKHGALYLLTLRLNPVIPYWLVNLAMGLTAIRPSTYVPLTIAGLAPASLIYVHAGTSLATLESAHDIVSPELLLALLALSTFPLLARAALARLSAPAAGADANRG